MLGIYLTIHFYTKILFGKSCGKSLNANIGISFCRLDAGLIILCIRENAIEENRDRFTCIFHYLMDET